MSFAGRVAVVTGGTNGIGRATVKTLVGRGAACVVLDIDLGRMSELEAELAEAPGTLAAIRCDVTDPAAVEGAVRETVDRFGRIDIVVNCAGGSGMTPFYKTEEGRRQLWAEEIPLAEWEATVALNLTAPFLLCKYAIPHLKRQGWGRIINFSSIGAYTGHINSSFAYAAYAAAKAGVVGLTHQLARELAAHGVTVNCVSPGATMSERIAARFDSDWKREGADLLMNDIPLRRLSTVDEQAAAVVFLASEEAAYVTGATIDVNGGRYMR